jgi:hypothetical protein
MGSETSASSSRRSGSDLKAFALASLFALALGCVAPALLPPASNAALSVETESSTAFLARERPRLAELASVDPRLALRLGMAPVDADPFAFEARALKLDVVAHREAALSRGPRGAREPGIAAQEAELFSRLIKEEQARVDEERLLPRSGSELVRGVVATWNPPASTKDLREHDAWLGSKLGEILASLAVPAPLTATEISELEDALDPLERLANPAGYPDTQGALARLRIALAASRPTAGHGFGWEMLHQRLLVHLGIGDSEPSLRDELTRTEARLRAEAKSALASLSEAEARAVVQNTEVLAADDACKSPNGAPGMRGFGPPPERALLCAGLHALLRGDLPALVALHDAVVVATWALAVHVDGLDPVEAPHGRGLLGEVPPERLGRLTRLAAVRPVACIAVARMAALLDAESESTRREKAQRWIAYGDAPLDVVLRDQSSWR